MKNIRRIAAVGLLAAAAAMPMVTKAAGTPDADIVTTADNVTATFGTVKTAGLAIASGTLLITLGFWGVKKFYRRG